MSENLQGLNKDLLQEIFEFDSAYESNKTHLSRMMICMAINNKFAGNSAPSFDSIIKGKDVVAESILSIPLEEILSYWPTLSDNSKFIFMIKNQDKIFKILSMFKEQKGG
jgi:hypothetical protein